MSRPRADVVVIGAGLIGCATARALALRGCDVLVLDAGGVGADASGATAGNIHLQLSPSTYAGKSADWIRSFSDLIPFFLAGRALWMSLAPSLPRDIELATPGGLMVAETEEQFQALRDKARIEGEQGLSIEVLAANEVAARAPYLAGHVVGGILCEGEGWVNPLLAVAAFHDAARAGGARFATDCRVHALRDEAGGWVVDTEDGPVAAGRVVVATGRGTPQLLDPLGIALGLTDRVIQMLASEPCEPFVGHLLHHAAHRLTLKQTANGNVLMGGGWDAALDPHHRRPSVLRSSIEQALWVAQSVVPEIGGLHLLRSWSGYNVYTPDGRPYIGEVPGRPGLFLAVCNTYGFSLGPLIGEMAACAAVGAPAPWPLDAFSPGRHTP